MTKRVQALRKESVETHPSLSAERALLLTRFVQDVEGRILSPAVRRAMAFQYIMKNRSLWLGDGELIVGERGPRPKATPTFPEICCHTLEELEILNSRKKVSYLVDDQTRQVYRDRIIPYWKGKTLRETLFVEMTEEWKEAYQSGIFTEFMEQRAPGHTALDNKIYHKGMLDFRKEIESRIESLDFLHDPEAYSKREELRAMAIVAEALISYAKRYADLARSMAKKETDKGRKEELLRIADVCKHVPANPPRNTWEALQCYWFVHVGVITELNTWDAFSPGRLDQHLAPFYQKDIADGTFTVEQIREILSCFWIKFNNQPAPAKVGVTAEESGTYNDFVLISLGGLTPEGFDGVNDLSYLILDVLEEMRLVQPHCCIQLSQKNPDRFLKRAVEVIRTGMGQPSVFNADAVVAELIRQGKTIEDARNGGTSGCVEIGAFGKENYNLTGYFNLPKIFELALNHGKDPKTGRTPGKRAGLPRTWKSFDDFYKAFEIQMDHFVDVKVRGNNVIERLFAAVMPTPLLSLLISDCIENGKDYHDGGARYNTSYIQGVGIGTVTDALTSLQYHVFDKKTLSISELGKVLRDDFKGHEKIRQTMLNKTPKYGNDDPYADKMLRKVFESYFRAVDGRKNTKGGSYRINLLPTTVHVYFGSMVGALPDGRKAWEPLSEGVSPVQGADRQGPTAVLRSVARIDHLRTGGTLLNQKFTPAILEGETGIEKLARLIRSYFRLNGHHIQFNVVQAELLREAQKEPDTHRNLIVRVAGYSDYFCNLSKPLQDEIIARTEHGAFR